MHIETLAVGSFMANCYLLWEKKGSNAFVIDPGDEVDRIKSVIDKNNLLVKYIILTHAHIDHVSAVADLQEYSGAKVLMHEDEQAILDSLDGQASLFSLPEVKKFKVDRFVEDNDVICVDRLCVKVLATPGHSPGGISLHVDKHLFVGDILFSGSIGRTDLPGGKEKILFDSIWNKIMILPDETMIYPGHGPATSVGEERRTNPFLSQWV